ncbi:MAG: hypothetical protein ACE5PT_01295 [Gemmatimonadales bacterium]
MLGVLEPLSFDRIDSLMGQVARFPITSIVLLAAIITAWACGGRGARLAAPASPEAAVRGFFAAVRANSLRSMGELWGGRQGPASRYMSERELEQRLTVIRIYLEHEAFEILPPEAVDAVLSPDRRIVRVRLTRKGCTPIVPFTLERYRDGWLVHEIDLAAAGNPARSCESAR